MEKKVDNKKVAEIVRNLTWDEFSKIEAVFDLLIECPDEREEQQKQDYALMIERGEF